MVTAGAVGAQQQNKGKKMKAEFYDVKMKKKVTAEVTEKIVIEKNGRFAFKGLTDDGRPLTRFVSKADYDAAKIDGSKCKKAGCKKK